jgi:hypothetical protein
VIVPGCAGTFDVRVTVSVWADPLPHELDGVTVIVPPLPVPIDTVTLEVPVPAVMLHPVGKLQL